MFGEELDFTSLQDPIEYPLEMYMYHFETSSWTTGPGVASLQLSRLWAKSALGKDETSIYYVGGQYPSEPIYENRTRYFMDPAPMDQILIFDINSQQWRTESTTGVTPSTRAFHTLTLNPKTGELIMLGGVEPINQTDYRGDYSYVLDTDRMEWSARNVTNADPGATFTVTVIQEHSGTELYIMFGHVPYESTSDVRVLDIESWSWKASITGVQDAEPTESSPTDPESSGSGTSAGTIAGAVVGSIAGVAIIGAALVFFWLRRRRQAKKEEVGPNNFGAPAAGQSYQGQNYAVPTSPTATNDGSTTQVSSTADPHRADASKFYGTEKPDGVLRMVMQPVKPDGA
ncbi:hypothetical protein BJV82DRAFT_205048 [Fennellomyces sp. T-0311]|nr:hypothetical protein BJV82DRAFT_205048 [Fennellomyces sp. T-0311]